MTNRIYIAGSVHECPRVAKHMARVRDIGYEVARDWTTEARRAGPVAPAELAEYSKRIAADVRSADVFWVLSGGKSLFGALAELGFAVGVGVKDVIASGHVRRPAGIYHSVIAFKKPIEALRWLHARLHGTELPQATIDAWTAREEQVKP